MVDIATLGLEVKSDRVVSATHRLRDLEVQAGGTERAFGLLRRVASGLFAAFSIGALVQMTSAWTDMNSRVVNATGSLEKSRVVMSRLESMARRTYSGLTQTAESYLQNATALTQLGYSTEQQLDLTESLNNALVISAAKGERAASVMNAWSKAMALGKLSGENLNTIMQSGGRVTQALADSMGVSVLELRRLGQEGKITGAEMFGVTSQLEKLRAEADAMPATIVDAFTLMGNAVFGFVGRIDQATGASSRIAEIIISMADSLSGFTATAVQAATLIVMGFDAAGQALGGMIGSLGDLSGVVAVVGAMFAGYFGATLLGMLTSATVAIGVGMVGAVKALTLAMLANPIGLLVAAIAGVITAAYVFRDQILQIFGVDLLNIFKGVANNTIGLFVGAYDAIVAAWGLIPAAFENIFTMAMNGAIDIVQNGVNGIIGALRTIPGLGDLGDVDLSGWKREDTGALGKTMGVVQEAFGKGFSRDYLGEISAGLNDVWTSAGEAAGAIAGLNGTLDGNGEGGGMAGALQAANDNLDPFKQMLQEMGPLLEAQRDPLQQLQYEMDTLGALLNAGKISWEQYGEAASRAQLLAASSTLGSVGQISGALTQLFKDNKAFAIANAVINTAEGVTKALAQGGMFGFIGAAAVAASGAAQIASILSAQPGSASTPSVNGGAGNTAPQQTPGTALNFTFRGSGSINIDEFVDQFTKQIADGGFSDFIKVVKAA